VPAAAGTDGYGCGVAAAFQLQSREGLLAPARAAAAAKLAAADVKDAAEAHVAAEAKAAADTEALAMFPGPAGRLLAELFDGLDKDDSGQFEEAEGKAFLRIFMGVDDPEELQYSWKDLLRRDLNGDGLISKPELLQYCLGDEPLTSDGAFEDGALQSQLCAELAQLRAAEPPKPSPVLAPGGGGAVPPWASALSPEFHTHYTAKSEAPAAGDNARSGGGGGSNPSAAERGADGAGIRGESSGPSAHACSGSERLSASSSGQLQRPESTSSFSAQLAAFDAVTAVELAAPGPAASARLPRERLAAKRRAAAAELVVHRATLVEIDRAHRGGAPPAVGGGARSARELRRLQLRLAAAARQRAELRESAAVEAATAAAVEAAVGRADVAEAAERVWRQQIDAALPVRARPGRLSGLSILHSNSVLYGTFVRARRALSSQNRRFLARAGGAGGPRAGLRPDGHAAGPRRAGIRGTIWLD
jgi:hypothetical protein